MSIDMEWFRTRLKQREKELLAELERSSGNARAASSGDVEDEADMATADQEQDLDYEEGDRQFDELTEVREALGRMDAGTFGKCTVCGREIEKARLEAVPWTRYCIDDARAREGKTAPPTL
jgi:DnaK suppressor protein